MDDNAWMRHALTLAGRGLGRVWPNPAVGCVLVRDGKMIGEGWTQDGGRPHAEAHALLDVDARGATAYVTLEPCAHHGKTPPCTEALIKAGVSRVVIATLDPDKRVDGRGVVMLKSAGVEVETGLMALEAEALNAGFLKVKRHGIPLVTLKLASTLDGRIATSKGESRWITGAEARLYAHHLRKTHDAIMVGAGTVRADDPMLNVRGLGNAKQPVRVVVDSGLSLSLTGRIARSVADQPVWLLHGPSADKARIAAWRSLGAVCHKVQVASDGRLDMRQILLLLAKQGLTRILCEGGGKLAATLLGGALVDEVQLITAGKILGGDGTPNVAAMGLARLSDAPMFQRIASRRLGQDLLTRWITATDAKDA